MIKHLVRLKSLTLKQWQLLLSAFLLLPLCCLFLQLLGFNRTRSIVARIRPSQFSHSKKEALELGYQTSRLVSVAVKYGIYQPTCLAHSIALWVLLLRQGIDANLRIGVQSINNNFNAHAWIELNGDVLNDSADVSQRFMPIL